MSVLLLRNVTVLYRLLIKWLLVTSVSLHTACSGSLDYILLSFLRFFCKVFESIILWTMAILVILLVPFISCIKKNLNVDKNNRSNLDSTTVRSNCKAVSAASKILSICMSKGQWTRVPRESLREKKKKFSKNSSL